MTSPSTTKEFVDDTDGRARSGRRPTASAAPRGRSRSSATRCCTRSARTSPSSATSSASSIDDMFASQRDRRGRGPGRQPDRRGPEGLRLRLPGRRRRAARRRRLQPGAGRAAGRAARPGRLQRGLPVRARRVRARWPAPTTRWSAARTRKGNPITVRGTGYFARCLQHETDHLYGYLYIDRLSKRDRKDALRQMAEREPRYPVVAND